jgi:hypothetical protein
MDLRANLDASIILTPNQRALIPTGLFLELPEGTEAQVRPRNGLAFKHGITVAECVLPHFLSSLTDITNLSGSTYCAIRAPKVIVGCWTQTTLCSSIFLWKASRSATANPGRQRPAGSS